MNISRTVYRYQPDVDRDNRVIELLQGYKWSHKRVYRVYKLLKLHLRRKGKKRLPNRSPQPLMVPDESNHCWSIDFMSDALWCGRRFRTFNVLDDFNREVLDIEIDLSLRVSGWYGRLIRSPFGVDTRRRFGLIMGRR